MLSSIHPLGERAKNNRFSVTATAFAVGSVVGGATTGAVVGGVGAALGLVTDLPGSRAAALVVAGVALVAAGFEWSGAALPSLHRQVDERWLEIYRNWVYGLGYGFQLGTGVVTYITTAAVYVLFAAVLLVGDLRASIAVMVLFGLVRGLSIVPARTIRTPDRLVEFHDTLQRRAPMVRHVSTATLGVVAVVSTAAIL